MNSEKNGFDSLNGCGRKEDLVTYLYAEANATDRASFESHLDYCAECRDELTAFGRVRRDLGAWQLGSLASPGIVAPRGRLDLLRELIGAFPVWVRGAAIIGAAAAMLLASLSIAGTKVSLKDGEFAVSFGRTVYPAPTAPAVSSEEIGRMVQKAVAEEREKMEERYGAQLASFKDQLNAESQARLRSVKTENQARLKIMEAALKQEVRGFNRQNTSIRSFFARDDSSDPWGDSR
jgi:hypothetical protein